MEKLVRFLPVGMALVYLAKCLSIGPSPVDAAILATLAGLYGYTQFKTENTQLTELKVAVETLNKELEASNKKIEEIRSHTNSMKLGLNIRSGNLSQKQG